VAVIDKLPLGFASPICCWGIDERRQYASLLPLKGQTSNDR
jgi:hypothetical protein